MGTFLTGAAVAAILMLHKFRCAVVQVQMVMKIYRQRSATIRCGALNLNLANESLLRTKQITDTLNVLSTPTTERN